MLDFSSSDFQTWERFYRARFFNSLGGYKSLNLLGTASSTGQTNLGLFFSVIHVGANPPLLGLLFRPHTVPRHSLENFRESGQATLNAVHADILAPAHQSSASYSAEESEFAATGLNPAYREAFQAPYVQESRLSAGLLYREEHRVEANDCIFVVAEITWVRLDEKALFDDGLIEHSAIDSLAVNALDSYYRPAPFRRYDFARAGEDLKELPWPPNPK